MHVNIYIYIYMYVYMYVCMYLFICLMFSVNSFTLSTTYVSFDNFRAAQIYSIVFCGSVQVDGDCKGFCVL
jgi:hypothetical protein